MALVNTSDQFGLDMSKNGFAYIGKGFLQAATWNNPTPPFYLNDKDVSTGVSYDKPARGLESFWFQSEGMAAKKWSTADLSYTLANGKEISFAAPGKAVSDYLIVTRNDATTDNYSQGLYEVRNFSYDVGKLFKTLTKFDIAKIDVDRPTSSAAKAYLGALDKLYAQFFDGKDQINGGAKADVLLGFGGADTIKSGGGNDRITGGTGADKLYGRAGNDTFVFKALSDSTVKASGQDTIFDFTHGDHFDLSVLDASSKKGGNQTFSFIGTEKFHGKAGELRYEKKSSDTYVYADTDGDKKADFAFHLDDTVKLVKADFLL